jgi:hypothetical protein
MQLREEANGSANVKIPYYSREDSFQGLLDSNPVPPYSTHGDSETGSFYNKIHKR